MAMVFRVWADKRVPLNLQWLVLRIGGANFLHCWATDSISLERAESLITKQYSFNGSLFRTLTNFTPVLPVNNTDLSRTACFFLASRLTIVSLDLALILITYGLIICRISFKVSSSLDQCDEFCKTQNPGEKVIPHAPPAPFANGKYCRRK